MFRNFLVCSCFLTTTLLAEVASATRSAELYTGTSYGYGRVSARLRFAAGDGVVSSFFLWKNGSEVAGTFWNELDFEKLGADCHIETNAFYGAPAAVHVQRHTLDPDPCSAFHTYTYEWTPESIAWLVDDVEIRRETGATAAAFADNAAGGMQIRFNIWPGDASFGGNFNPSILPVHQYVDWVEFSSYADGEFTLEWREELDGESLPAGWVTGSWSSPKNLSTHDRGNVNLVDGYGVLSLTADGAVGPAGADPEGSSGTGGGGGMPGPPSSGDDGGCSIATSKTSGWTLVLGALGLAALGAWRRRPGRSSSVR
jgi:endo-1,3-1,4-beta-glycanase ExoK